MKALDQLRELSNKLDGTAELSANELDEAMNPKYLRLTGAAFSRSAPGHGVSVTAREGKKFNLNGEEAAILAEWLAM